MSEEASWKRHLEKYHHIAPDFEIDPKTAALMIIDMQYVDAHPEYGLGTVLRKEYPEVASYYFNRLSESVIPNLISIIKFFRQNRLRIVYVTVGSILPDGSDETLLRRQRKESVRKALSFSQGTFEHTILEEIKPQAGELVINKTSVGAFNSTAIDQILRNMGVESLIITGVVTNACVETTARDAADRGYKCVLVDDALAAHSQEFHDSTLRNFSVIFGQVRTSKEILGYLQDRLAHNSSDDTQILKVK